MPRGMTLPPTTHDARRGQGQAPASSRGRGHSPTLPPHYLLLLSVWSFCVGSQIAPESLLLDFGCVSP